MSKTIECSIDVLKIDKSRLVDRVYKNKDGQEVKEKLFKFSVVESNDKKFITQGDGWKAYKTHFLAEKRGKDEPKNYVGEGITFEREEAQPLPAKEDRGDDINPDDIPF